MYSELEKLHNKVFDVRCITIKANPVIMQAINEQVITIERDPIDAHCGVDWQGNTFEVIDDSIDLIESIFNGAPLNFGDEEDYEYSLTALQPYTVTVNEAIEIFSLTEGLIITTTKSLHTLYDDTRNYLSGLRDYHAWNPHGGGDLEEDYEKMTEVVDWLRPVVKRMSGSWQGTSILSRIFADAAKVIGVDVDKTDIVITKKAQVEKGEHLTFDDLLGGRR